MKQALLSLGQSQIGFTQKLLRWLCRSPLNLLLWSRYINLCVLLLVAGLLLPKPLLLAQDVLLGLTSTGGTEGGGTAFSIKSNGNDFTVQKTFGKSGVNPSENLCRGFDGNFYGMTYEGGTDNLGAIFKMTSSGTITILRSFTASDGVNPQGSLIQGTDGNFYGMTTGGGSNHFGTIFKMTSAGTFTVLHNFDYYNGGNPYGSLVQGIDGNLYGVTYHGAIFKVTTGGVFTVLHHLNTDTDGWQPYGNLVRGNDGNFYGLTNAGGTYNFGTIFRITTGGTFTVLRHFNSTTDGGYPYGSLVKGTDGNFYGMTYRGGIKSFGTIFKITFGGTFTVLRSLDYNNDGGYPRGNLVQGTDGSFYGITNTGGANHFGTFFKITAGGAFTVLRHMDRRNEYNYLDGYSLVQGGNGDFYGMAYSGGTYVKGAIFKITPAGNLSSLVNFPEAFKGHQPTGSLVQAHDGYFYGMTLQGGIDNFGTIFNLCNNNFLNIKSFDYFTTGANPKGTLIQATDGNFYGMTYEGGTIFKITSNGTLTVLHQFNFENDGAYPYGSLVQGTDGNFYGTTSTGGNNWGGTIFRITPTGTFTVLRHLSSSTDGAYPHSGLVQGSDGNFYGINNFGGKNGFGTIFKISATGVFTLLHHLEYKEGGEAFGGLVQSNDGNFYGMTSQGGANGSGTIFKITSTGTLTVLRNLNNTNDGSYPRGSLVQGSDGSLYGMTKEGGTYNAGSIFKITTNGVFSVLRYLNKDTDGANPWGSLIIQKSDPVAQAQSVSTLAGTAKTITLTATAPSSPLTYTIASSPKNGTLSGSGANYTYTPKAGFSGTDSFTFTATWGCQVSKVQTVSINVTGSTSSVTLTPVADAYVRNGTYAATNYGSAASLFVKGTTSSGYARTSYLKFSLGNVTSVSSAKLKVYGNNTENTTAINLSAYGLSNDGWTESGITWNNAPLASGAVLSSVSVNNQAQYYELDVTSFVQAQVAGDKVVSFLLKDAANKNLNLGFNSKEHTANPPQLVIQTAPALSTIRLNSGGEALTTSVGSFSADAYYSGSTSLTTSTSAIANTEDDALYQTTRKAAVSGGSFAYQVPVSNGTYTVKLHMVELAFIAAGKRQFHVTAEGAGWLSNYDIYAAAGGGKKAVVASKNITVSDGTLNLNFISVVDKASIAAIEVLPAPTGARLMQNVEEASSNQQVNLYPNPATDKITIKLTEPAQQIETTITDLTGVVHSHNIHQKMDGTTLEVPVSSLPPSVYLLHLTTEHGRYTLKFVKQ